MAYVEEVIPELLPLLHCIESAPAHTPNRTCVRRCLLRRTAVGHGARSDRRFPLTGQNLAPDRKLCHFQSCPKAWRTCHIQFESSTFQLIPWNQIQLCRTHFVASQDYLLILIFVDLKSVNLPLAARWWQPGPDFVFWQTYGYFKLN